MTRYSDFHPPQQPGYAQFQPPPPKKKMPTWAWMLIGIAAVVLVSCGGCFLYLSAGPDTKVYTGNEVPAKYVSKLQSLGVLTTQDQIRFFYSDAINDIEDGFALLTDKKIVVYKKDSATPATHIPYTRVRAADMTKSTSLLKDSTIKLTLDDKSVIQFPVSNEEDRDQIVLDYIKDVMPKGGATAAPKTR